MRRFQAFSIISALVLSAAGVRGQLQTNESQQKLEFPHAGVALKLPGDFERRRLVEPFDVLSYALVRDGVTEISVSLSAFPVDEDETPKSLADSKLEDLRGRLAMRKFRILKTAEMPVAGVTGHAVRMSYTFGGIETTAAQLYFIREVSESPVRICYLLTIEERGKETNLLPVLGDVVRTLKFVSFRRPGELPVPEADEQITRPELGFVVRPPVGWFADSSPQGVSMGQMDYVLGGVAVPMVHVRVGRVRPGETTEQFVDRHLDLLREDAEGRNVKVEVLSKGEAELAGHDGSQFVVRHSTDSPGGSSQESRPAIIVQRTIFEPREGESNSQGQGGSAGGNERPRAYTLACIYNGDDEDRPVEILEKVAEGFSLVSEDADEPTTSTAPAVGAAYEPERISGDDE
ncbi:MAG: hypothetical protein ACLFVW_09855 [Phycisphaerae bacterium]